MNSKDKAPSDMNTNAAAQGDAHDDPSHDQPIKLDLAAQVMIGQQLKAMYSDFVQQEIPAHLLRLLDELAAKEDQEKKS